MFNLNDSRWGRGDDKSGDPAKPNDATPDPEPAKPAVPNRRPANASSGPPDLDELWRDFNRKLGSLFGGKPALGQGGGNGGSGGRAAVFSPT